jgi:formylglycine-generating enzyme required for sulfatase activity
MKCLARNYEERYRSFEEVLAAMGRLEESTPETPDPPMPEPPLPSPPKTWRLTAAAALIILLVSGIAGARMAGWWGNPTPPASVSTPEPVKPEPPPERKTNTLTVKTVPGTAVVTITDPDGKTVSGPELPLGDYRVTASADGFEPAEKKITLAAGPPLEETLELKKIVVKNARLTVETDPKKSTVKIVGLKEPYRSGMELPPGNYTLEISAKDYEKTTEDIRLEPGEPMKLRVKLSRIQEKTVVSMSEKAKEPERPVVEQKKPEVVPAKAAEAAPERVRTNSIGMRFVYIKPGTFMMGSTENEPEREGDETLHQVTLTRGYYLQTTEVTQGQWKRVMGDNPSEFKNCGDDCPVDSVSWTKAQAFIKKLNKMEGGARYRLPTEAEWEYACRAGSKEAFSFGPCLGTDQANYNGDYPLDGCSKGRYRKKTTKVASFPANAWGLYDMHGNVCEWCSDRYGDYPSDAVTDPLGASTGSSRVLRGGSWSDYARGCRSVLRRGFDPGDQGNFYGFRVALSTGQ